MRLQKGSLSASGALGGLRGAFEFGGMSRGSHYGQDVALEESFLLAPIKSLVDMLALRRKQAKWIEKLVNKGRALREAEAAKS